MGYPLKIQFLLFFFLASFLFISAQELYTFKQISYEQGLPGVNVKYVFQDSRGTMWFAIEALGLCKYDGFKFTLFSNEVDNNNGLSSNYINEINEDINGDIWIATDDGLNKYDYKTEKFTQYFFNENDTTSIPNDVILTVSPDVNGNVWIGTDNGFAKFDIEKNNCTRYLYSGNKSSGYERDMIYSIHIGQHNSIWIGSTNGLYLYDQDTMGNLRINRSYLIDDFALNSVVHDMTEDHAGNLWLATTLGLYQLKIKENTLDLWDGYIGEDKYMRNQTSNSLHLDNSKLWVGTSSYGIVIIETTDNSYKLINNKADYKGNIKSNHIRSITSDNNGAIWIGTKFEGVFQYFGRDKVLNKFPEKYEFLLPISTKYTMCFHEDNDNNYWIGTKYSGLFKANPSTGEIINYTGDKSKPMSLASDRVQHILKDLEENIWVATDKGLNLLDEQNKRVYRYDNINIYYLFEDSRGIIWAGTRSGIFVVDKNKKALVAYKSKKLKYFFHSNEFEVLFINEDKSGCLWFSTRNSGVYGYYPESGAYFQYSKRTSPENKINSNMIRPVYEDFMGNVWIGTKETGFEMFDTINQKFIGYNVKNGLPSNMVLSIEQDLEGNLWLGTNNGISRFNLENKNITNFNQENGLRSNVCETNMSYRFEDGALLFGGSNGFNVFYPNDINKPKQVSNLVVSSIIVNEKESYHDVVEPKVLELKYFENNITVDFHLTDYKQPRRHQFKTLMSGIDEGWKSLGNRNYVSFSGLKPGKYILNIQASNELGNWTDPIPYVTIEISPPWWNTWWFRIVVLVLALSIFLWFYYMRVLQVKWQKIELEKQVIERTAQLNETNTLLEERQQHIEEQSEELIFQAEKLEAVNNDLRTSNATKDQLLSIIAHDLKNPFNNVLGFSELICASFDSMEPEKIKNMVQKVNDSSTVIYELLDNLLIWARSQKGEIRYNPELLSVSNMVNKSVKLLDNMITSKNNTVNVDISENLQTNSDKNLLSTVLRNILTNAIKFTENGKVDIASIIEGEKIYISIKDTGIGMPENRLQDLFVVARSKSTKGTKGELGTGLGMIITKQFVVMNGGEIEAFSKQGEGTHFRFSVPLYKG